MTLREFLKIIHILAAMTWFGGAVWARLLAVRVAASRDRDRALQFARDMLMGTRIFTGSKSVVLVSGVFLVFESSAWRFGQRFVMLGLAVSGLGVTLGLLYFKPQSERVVAEIEGGGFGRPHNIARMRLLGRMSTLELVLFVVVVWAMVVGYGL